MSPNFEVPVFESSIGGKSHFRDSEDNSFKIGRLDLEAFENVIVSLGAAIDRANLRLKKDGCLTTTKEVRVNLMADVNGKVGVLGATLEGKVESSISVVLGA